MKKSAIIVASVIGIAVIGACVSIPVINNKSKNDVETSGSVVTQVTSGQEQQTTRPTVQITSWKPVGEYTDNSEFRTAFDEALGVTKDSSNTKTGAFYTGKGNDVTLADTLGNTDLAQALKKPDIKEKLSTLYADADSIPSDMSRAALINGYFNLLDTSNGFYNSSLMISQEEYLNAVVKATTARKTFSYTDSESITEQELIANSLRAKQGLKVSAYVTKAEAYSILSKELGITIEPNGEESGDNLTRGEALNLIVNTLINNSEIVEEFNEVPSSEAEQSEEQASNEDTPTYSEPAQTYNESSQSQGSSGSSGGYSMSEEERQALLDEIAAKTGARRGNSVYDDPNTKDGGSASIKNDSYMPGLENIRLH